MATRAHVDHWRYERTGYEERPTVAYAAGDRRPAGSAIHWTAWERRAAMMVLLGGLFWALRLTGPQQRDLARIWGTPGVVESCGIAALLWLHAWWRSTVRLK